MKCQRCGKEYKGSSHANLCARCAYIIKTMRKAGYADEDIFWLLAHPEAMDANPEVKGYIERVCPLCGEKFIPSSSTSGYCNPCMRTYNLLHRYRGMKIEEIRAVIKAGALESVMRDIEKEILQRQMRAMEEEA